MASVVSVCVGKVFRCNETVTLATIRVHSPENNITRTGDTSGTLKRYTKEAVESGFCQGYRYRYPFLYIVHVYPGVL